MDTEAIDKGACSLVRNAIRTIGSVSLALLGTAALAAWPGVSDDPAAGPTDAARLLGDWEPPDAFLVGRQELWGPAADSLLATLRPLPVYVVEPANGAHESAWVRDYGPVQIARRGRIVWLDPDYHPGRPADDALPGTLGTRLGAHVEPLPLRLDGGGVVSDGRGLCAMTEAGRRSLAPLRSSEIARRLGCLELVVVPALPAEPTGHVDLMIQFLGPDVVAVAELRGSDVSTSDRARLDLTARRLTSSARSMGRRLRVVRVPVYRTEDERFLSYVNVVALRHRLLVPDFRDVPPEIQREAHATLRRASGKPLVPIPADAIALVGGGLHCIVLGLHLAG